MTPIIRSGIIIAAAMLVLGPATGAAAAEKVEPQEIRDAVTRSLPYLEREGQHWIDDKKCVSCHRVTFLTWSFSAARNKGFEIDQVKLDEWNNWSRSKSLEKVKDGTDVDGSRNMDGLAQIILGSIAYQNDDERRRYLEPLVPLLHKGQRADGAWGAGGQLPMQKRPKLETDQVTTMWIALALGELKDDAAKASRDKALQWLAGAKPGKSTEWYAADLLLRHQQGKPVEDAIRQLTSKQNQDGGWGWLAGGKSDALATGTNLYALLASGVSRDDPAVVQATRYLLRTQQSDGSWEVPGTKTAKKDRIEETASYWGTAWAVIALLESLASPAG